VRRIAIDCAPALRTLVIRELVRRDGPARTSDIAAAVATVTKTASRYLEDLSLLQLAVHTKQSAADNAPDLWAASEWLRDYFPKSETEEYPPASQTNEGAGASHGTEPGVLLSPTLASGADARPGFYFDGRPT
jgi:hypothetical protein